MLNPIRSFNKKIMITLSTMLVCFALSLFWLVPAARNTLTTYRDDVIFLELVQSAGAELIAVNVAGWVRVDDFGNAGDGDPSVLVKRVASEFHLNVAESSTGKWENQYARGAKLEGKTPDGRVLSILGQTLLLPGGKNTSHVMVSSNGTDRGKAHIYKQEMNELLTQFGTSHVAVTYSGKIHGEMNGKELVAAAERLMSLAGASIQEKTVKDNLVSVTGLCPHFSSGLNYEGREVNLNVALRSNPLEQATYVYIASPVILTEY